MLAVFGLAGLSLRGDGIALDPRLPAAWDSVAFSFQWRGRRVKIGIDRLKRHLLATLEAGEPMSLLVGGKPHALALNAAASPIAW